MPGKKKAESNGHFSISYGTIGALVGIVTLVGLIMSGVTHLAMKSDVDVTWQRVILVQDKVQALEVQMARYFGAKPATSVQPAKLKVVAYQGEQVPAVPPPARRIVVSLEFIKDHQMVPSRGGAYVVLGADGQNYSLDDCVAALIEEHDKEHETADDKVKMQMQMKIQKK